MLTLLFPLKVQRIEVIGFNKNLPLLQEAPTTNTLNEKKRNTNREG